MAKVDFKITNVENLPSPGVINYIPKEFLGSEYVKLTKGMTIGIKRIVKDEFNVLDDEGEPMLRKDGSNVTNTVYYIGLDDGRYTTVKNNKIDVQIRLLMAGHPEFVEENVMDFGNDVFEVTTKETMIKYGDGKEYPGIVFE